MTSPHAEKVSSPERRRWSIRILLACLVSVGLGHSLLYSTLPPLARETGLSEFQTGVLFTVSAILWVVFSPYWGAKSDIWGRKPIILLGLGSFGISTLGFGLLFDAAMEGMIGSVLLFSGLMVSRAMWGLLGGGGMSGAQAYAVDRTEKSERVAIIALTGSAFGIGQVLGPAVGAIAISFGPVVPFYTAAVIAGISAVGVWLLVPEKTEPQKRDRPKSALRLWDKRLWLLMTIGTFMSTNQAITFQTAAFYIMDRLSLGLEATAKFAGIGFMVSAITVLIWQLGIIRYLKPRPITIMRLGAIMGVAAFTVFLVFDTRIGILAAMALAGSANACVRTGIATLATLAVEPDEQGAVAGLISSIGGTGFIIAPFIGAALYRYSEFIPFSVALGLSLFVLAFVYLHPSYRGRKVPHSY